jgi:hypothetical protein
MSVRGRKPGQKAATGTGRVVTGDPCSYHINEYQESTFSVLKRTPLQLVDGEVRKTETHAVGGMSLGARRTGGECFVIPTCKLQATGLWAAENC